MPPPSRSPEEVNSNHHNPEEGQLPQTDRRGAAKIRSTNYTNVECPSCQRIYTRRSLDFHLKVCTMRQAEEVKRRNAIESAIERQKRGPSRPPGKLCYICGRRYTKSSWEWHEPKCQEQWDTWNSRLPKDLQHRGGLLKPNTDDEALAAVVEQEKATGNPKFNKKDALEKILLEASRINALPVLPLHDTDSSQHSRKNLLLNGNAIWPASLVPGGVKIPLDLKALVALFPMEYSQIQYSVQWILSLLYKSCEPNQEGTN
uniref:Zinc finger protein 474 n=1 Tax=Echinococcus canadensis TaxID=519352 RepID=A0A915EYQ9_9CEST